MKRCLLISILSYCASISAYAEITCEEAMRQLENYVSRYDKNDSIGIYYYPRLVNADTILLANKDTLFSPPSNSYMFFIDDYPYHNWEHSCRLLFIGMEDGSISTRACRFPPIGINTWDIIREPNIIVKDLSPHLSIPKKRNTYTLNSNAEHCYAIIISGGMNPDLNYIRYWNDCSAMYTILKGIYGYLDENIYVIMADGTNPDIDRYSYNGIYESSPLDLDNDGINDIEYPATKESITAVCNELSSKLTEDDFLFVFTTDHGSVTQSGIATMCLWGDEIDAPTFAYEINKIKAGSINIVMEQCYSGGFVSVLSKRNRTIATACSSTEVSYACDYNGYLYNEFVYHWMSAVLGYTPDMVNGVSNVDTNNDNMISMKEAFDYAERVDVTPETPQYASIKPHYGEYVTLFGVNENQKTIINNQNITTDDVIHGYNIEIVNSTINNGADITVEASKTFVIGPNTKILGGGTLKTE